MTAVARAVPEHRRSTTLGIVPRRVARHADGASGDPGVAGELGLADGRPVLRRAGGGDATRGVSGRRNRKVPHHGGASRVSMREMLGQAMRHRQFLVLSGAYFVCGLNLVFLATICRLT